MTSHPSGTSRTQPIVQSSRTIRTQPAPVTSRNQPIVQQDRDLTENEDQVRQ